jgi:tetratricopeptide (TPR) repeat protein
MKSKSQTLSVFLVLIALTGFGQPENNAELQEIYNFDQSDRTTDEYDWPQISIRDSLRELRVLELLDSNKVITGKDYENAAMIFQHGDDSTSYRMVINLMKKAIVLDSTTNKWLLAAGIDRELMSRDEPQIYGTQFLKKIQEDGSWGPWERYKLDSTIITDKERAEFNVESLAEQKEKVRYMNWMPLLELMQSGKNTNEIVRFCKNEFKTGEYSDYIQEFELNGFGYELMNLGRTKEALKIFKLLVNFYPEASNAYDSLGECFLKLKKTKKGIKAYKKSVALNPKNLSGQLIIEQYE